MKRSMQFEAVVQKVEQALQTTDSAWFLDEVTRSRTPCGADCWEQFSVADVIFVPYVERMSASLYYYKGYVLRDQESHPGLARWFDALEALPSYRGE